MKRIHYLTIFLCLFLFSCKQDEVITPSNKLYTKFRASFEASTRTHIDNNLRMRWNEGDEISIFTSSANQRFKFDGSTGDRSGTFSKVYNNNNVDVEPTFTIVNAIYPYRDNNAISGFAPPYGGHVFTLEIPNVQDYAKDSFGEGASPMIASAPLGEESELYFRNVCGFLRLQLYGEDVTVDRIELTSMNRETINQPISGVYQFWIDGVNGHPTPIVYDDGLEENNYCITLDCGEGVTIGATEDNSTEFIFSLLPFSNQYISLRFTVYTTDNRFQQFDYFTTDSFEIERNVITTMAPKEFNSNMSLVVDDNEREALIEFYKATNGDEWTRNDNWCSDKPVGEWYGVEIHSDEYNGEVISFVGKLSLGNNNLNGEINNELKRLSKLTWLELHNNLLTSVDVSESNALTILTCNNNPIVSLSTPLNVGSLDCSDTLISELDVSDHTQLSVLNCSNTNISELNLSRLNDLCILNCAGTKIVGLNLDGLTKLTHLDCSAKTLSTISWNDCGSLLELTCNDTQLTSIDVTKFENLVGISCARNANLSSINASNLPMLRWFSCEGNNALTYLNVSNSFKYYEDNYLICNDNKILQNINVDNCTKLKVFRCWENAFSELNVSTLQSLTELDCRLNPNLTSIDVSRCTNLETLTCNGNIFTNLDLSHNLNLKVLFFLGAQNLLDLRLSTSIEHLEISHAPHLLSLDLAQYKNLRDVHIWNCINLSSVNLAELLDLDGLQIDNCNLSEIDLSGCPNLKYLRVKGNQFTKAPNLPLGLRLLDIRSNHVPDLDLSKYLDLETLYCRDCQIPVLDLTKHTKLVLLDCNENPITELDLRYTSLGGTPGAPPSSGSVGGALWCASPTLEKLYLKQGWSFWGITDNRNNDYIHPNTEIIFVDID